MLSSTESKGSLHGLLQTIAKVEKVLSNFGLQKLQIQGAIGPKTGREEWRNGAKSIAICIKSAAANKKTSQ